MTMGRLKEHKRFAIACASLLVLCLLVLFSYSQGGRTTVVGHAVQKVAYVITTPITKAVGGISDFFDGVAHYRDLQSENEALKEQVEALESENLALKREAIEEEELAKLYQAFDFTPYSPEDKAVAARVIATDLSNPYVVFTIDRGTESGIARDSIVVDGNGLVGIVTDAGKGWAKVSSVLSDGNDISFYTLRDKSVTGIVSGNGKNAMEGYVMDDAYRVIKGDALITTGVGFYPGGIKIGTVTKVEYDDDLNQRVITVEPTCDFRGMQKVAVFP